MQKEEEEEESQWVGCCSIPMRICETVFTTHHPHPSLMDESSIILVVGCHLRVLMNMLPVGRDRE